MTARVNKQCARCEVEVSLNALWGLCSKCLYDEASKLPVPVTGGVLNPQHRRFGDYELGEPLGRGGMGVVYQAMQVSLRRPVALKMILDSEAALPTSRRRFTLEAEAAAKLDHPNIVPIYEVGEHDGQPFLSMKFIAGENLRQKIAAGDLCLTPRGRSTSRTDIRARALAIARVMAAMARAVHHAHQHGVLHRDLKPANILVDRDGQPHLTDFGLAKMLEPEVEEPPRPPLTLSGTAIGTPSYMSPEQAAGRRLTAASDTYSLGAILYEMLTGEPPFQAGTLLETLRLVAEQEPKHPTVKNPRIDRDLDTICCKCLEKNPNARYPTAVALAEDLERWLRQEPIQARPAGPALRVRRWVARNRLGTALIVSLCIGLGVALALLQVTQARQKDAELRRANSVVSFIQRVDEMWKDNEQQSVLISSAELAEIMNLPPRLAEALTLRLTFGLSINQEPFGQALQYAPLLGALEQRLEKSLQRPVQIDLRLYKAQAHAVRDAARGQLDLQRMGAFLYLLSKQAHPGFEPVARERGQREAVIFASQDSGVTNLAQVAGRRVAFGQTNSTTSFWAKFHLASAGIRATNLQSCYHVDNGGRRRDDDLVRPEDRDAEIQSLKRVVQEVALGHADIGEAPRRQFELARYKKRGLVPLLTYRVTPDVYVARPGLDAEVVRGLRESLASIQGQEAKILLGKLSHNIVMEGFDAVGDADFNDLRSAQRHEVADFERGAGQE